MFYTASNLASAFTWWHWLSLKAGWFKSVFFPTTSSLHIPMDSHQTFLGFRLVFLVQLFHVLGTSSLEIHLQRPINMLEAHSLGGETIAWVGATYIRCMQTRLCLCPLLVYHLVLSIRPVAACYICVLTRPTSQHPPDLIEAHCAFKKYIVNLFLDNFIYVHHAF